MENIDKKVERFLELSLQFSKNAGELFPDQVYTLYTTGNDCVTSLRGNSMLEALEPTRSQQIREKMEAQIKKSDEYDEYKKLQKDLTDYYTAKNKLNT